MRLDDPLRSARLVLRSLEAGDATDRYLGWMNDPEVTRWTEARHAAHSMESLRAFIRGCNDDPAILLLGICVDDGATHIGNIKLGPVDRRHARAAIGLLIGDRAHWGRGVASEAIGRVTEHGFGAMGLKKLWAGCYAGNEASRRAFKRVGYVEEARQAGYWAFEGRREDNVLVGLTDGQWAARSA